MKTILESNFLINLEQSPLAKDLPNPKSFPPENTNLPSQQTDPNIVPPIPQKDSEGIPPDSNEDSFDNQNQDFDNIDNTQDMGGNDDQFQDPSLMDPGSNNIEFSKIYELRKIYQKLQLLRSMFEKFSDLELDNDKDDLMESIFLFQKILIPNLDTLTDRLDRIIKNYQNFIKTSSDKLEKFYTKKIKEKKEKSRRK